MAAQSKLILDYKKTICTVSILVEAVQQSTALKRIFSTLEKEVYNNLFFDNSFSLKETLDMLEAAIEEYAHSDIYSVDSYKPFFQYGPKKRFSQPRQFSWRLENDPLTGLWILEIKIKKLIK